MVFEASDEEEDEDELLADEDEVEGALCPEHPAKHTHAVIAATTNTSSFLDMTDPSSEVHVFACSQAYQISSSYVLLSPKTELGTRSWKPSAPVCSSQVPNAS